MNNVNNQIDMSSTALENSFIVNPKLIFGLQLIQQHKMPA